MTTALAFIISGLTALGAIVGGIWMEARLPAPQPSGTVSVPSPADLSPGAASPDRMTPGELS